MYIYSMSIYRLHLRFLVGLSLGVRGVLRRQGASSSTAWSEEIVCWFGLTFSAAKCVWKVKVIREAVINSTYYTVY